MAFEHNQRLIKTCFENLVFGNCVIGGSISDLARNIVEKVRAGENIDIKMPIDTEYNGHINMTLVCAAAATGALMHALHFEDRVQGASADVNKYDNLLWSTLNFAYMDIHPPNVCCLLDHGSHLFAKNADGQKPLDVCDEFLVLQRTRARQSDFRVIRDL